MDGPLQPRGRGFKINGVSSRPHSRNKQWIAGQDNSGHHSDGERWERGGGVRRGRGRGRGGSGRSTPQATTHLTVPVVQDEVMSGTDDEGQEDGHSANGMEDYEAEAVDVDEREPETDEERARFYQELVKAREIERKKAIAEGKMDDPLVPKRLDQAITMVGTCMDMCPRFERYRRERENNLDRWEVIPGTKRVDHKRAVKIYERAAGDKTLPSDLRPPPVLKKTLDYLFHDLIQRGGFSQTYNFIRDRSRAVRSDFTMQHETGALAMECHDRCARFHIMALHLERDNPNFSIALEEQQLMNTLQSLKEFYEDQRGRYSAPTELEMRVYHRLIHIRDQKERHEDIPPEIVNNPIFQLTTKFRLVVQAKSAPISKNSKLVVDQEGMEIFGQLAAQLREENNIVMIYLVACIMERLFGKDTIEDIEGIRGDLTIPEIIDGISRPIESISYEPTPTPEQDEPIELPNSTDTSQPVARSATEWLSSNFGSTPPAPAQPTSAFGSSGSAFGPASSQPAPQSAFSTLATASSSTRSVFGGPTFGNSTPKSVFGGPVFAPTSSASPSFPQQAPSPPAATPALPAPSTSTFSTPSFPSFPQTQPTAPSQASGPPSGALFPSPAAAQPATPPKPVFPSYKPAVSSPLNPNAASFTPTFTTPKYTESSVQPAAAPPPIPPLQIPTGPLTASPEDTVQPLAPSPPTPEKTPPAEEPKSESSTTPVRILDRRQTLWDFPGIPQLHDDSPTATGLSSGVPPTPVTPIPVSPSNMPQMEKPKPLTLPPTPTARWFDPASLPKPQDSALLLRKQSLGLLSLQMPSAPAAAEILSPLALPSPKTMKPSPAESGAPSPLALAEGVASSSKLGLHDLNGLPSPSKSSKGKEKAREAPVDQDAVAVAFLRKGTIVKKYFKRWVDRTTDRAAYAEALRRSDAYKAKVQRHRLSNSLSAIHDSPPSEAKKRRMSMTGSPEPGYAKRARKHRVSTEYRQPVSDEELARRLKENHEEHQRRWARGTFLETVRHRVRNATADEAYPPEWRIWLSTNTENDGTAIWLEQKFDVPESGEWKSESVFSIPVLPKYDNPPSPGCPGLIVFERTPMDGVDDVLERKYRILDDCSRLRDIIEAFRTDVEHRFKPSLVVIAWADSDGPEAAPDFGDMIRDLRASQTILDAQSFVISSTATDLDMKFDNLLAHLKLDVDDKLTAVVSWRALTSMYATPLKTYASDWLDSCWPNDRLDWTRYGEVSRSLEDVQNAFLKELLVLLDGPTDATVETPVDLEAPAHLGAAYASGPFLDACLKLPVARAEELLGDELASVYAVPRHDLEESRRRFEALLQSKSDRLRQLAAASLSQKRPASDESPSGSPSSMNKRFKVSVSPATTERNLDADDVELNGFLTPPPPSTAVSTAALSEAPPKPQVTIAMLRALAQGVLKSSKS